MGGYEFNFWLGRGLAIFLVAVSAPALAQCVDVTLPQKEIADRGGTWSQLTRDQWQFLRGIYAMNPLTPPGLPFGDKAAVASVPGREGGLVFFLDEDRACSPMPVPDTLIKMLTEISTGEIKHEGNPL